MRPPNYIRCATLNPIPSQPIPYPYPKYQPLSSLPPPPPLPPNLSQWLRRDAYLPGVQALARSLRLVRTRYPLIVMYTRTCRWGSWGRVNCQACGGVAGGGMGCLLPFPDLVRR